MIINPIIPVLLMLPICLVLTILVVYDKQSKKIKITKKSYTKLGIIILLFIMNLRFMLPNGEALAVNSDLSVLFVIDTSVSMRALDYDGNKERFEAVRSDCSHIIDELSGAKFSIITFGDSAKKVIPFTTDSDMAIAEINSIALENDFYAKGTSLNLVKDTLEKTFKSELKRQEGKTKFVVFFVTDGEITKDNETLESFASFSQYITNGAVMGYGTTAGGKMINSTYIDEPTSDYYYIYYYDSDYNMKTAISKLDENNLKKLSTDLGIDYINMSKQSNIDSKISQIQKQMAEAGKTQDKITSYQDTYYYFALPLVILLILDFINKKRKM